MPFTPNPNPPSTSGIMFTSSMPKVAQETIPFLVEPIIAHKVWTIGFNKKGFPVLRSLTYKIRWPYKKPLRSHCMAQWTNSYRKALYTMIKHSAPNMQHKCGIYSLKEMKGIDYWTTSRTNAIYGTIALWGKVFEYEDGYLSEYAYPKTINGFSDKWDQNPEELIYEISNLYEVEVRL